MDDLLAERSQFDSAPASFENHRTLFIFQFFDRETQGRLRHTYTLSGTAEMEFLSHSDDIAKFSEDHGLSCQAKIGRLICSTNRHDHHSQLE
jgi:hypothetical protein